MERAIKQYIDEVQSEVSSMVYSDGEGASFEDKFTEYCMEVLETIGKSEGARVLSYVHPNSVGGIDWKINGYCLKDQYLENGKIYYETLDLFITSYKSNNYLYKITQADYSKSLNQIKKFANQALKRHIDYIDKSHTELIELIRIIGSQGNNFDRINIFYLINGFSNHDKEFLDISGTSFFVHTWDLDRLFKINESSGQHEPIEIDVASMTLENIGLPCLEVPSIDKTYKCYLAIVPGSILADLYMKYSNELLESNVRAFLGQAGKFNKGIRDTIRNKPQMFLPYNNGITATAENVETKIINNLLYIKKLYDFQIVNGGQTTASLYHTQKKHKDADLSKIFVQMKLTVITDPDKKNIEVPFISRFANSQNKVTELDLSSNNPYFVSIENLSRKKYVINPENINQSFLWYFERTNGQYRETLNKLTTSKQKKFKEQNPTNLKYVKSDIAKYINILDLEPHYVAQGSQKNFIHYTKKIDDLVRKNKFPGENFYKKLISNAILYKTVDKLFGRKNIDAIGDTNIKGLTVTYSLSYFHFLTDNRFNLWNVYENQKVNDKTIDVLKNVLIFVYNHIVKESQNLLISEFAKKESSWKKLKETTYPTDLLKLLQYEIISIEEREERNTEKELASEEAEEILFQISNIRKLGLKFWDGLRIMINKTKNIDYDYSLVFDITKKLKENKNLTNREINYGNKLLKIIENEPKFHDEMRSYSLLEDFDIIDLKSIYDKLSFLNKNDWNRIIDLASQTKIFDHLELANIKSVYNAIARKDKIREQSILKGFESIKKLKKFGINI